MLTWHKCRIQHWDNYNDIPSHPPIVMVTTHITCFRNMTLGSGVRNMSCNADYLIDPLMYFTPREGGRAKLGVKNQLGQKMPLEPKWSTGIYIYIYKVLPLASGSHSSGQWAGEWSRRKNEWKIIHFQSLKTMSHSRHKERYPMGNTQNPEGDLRGNHPSLPP